MKIGDTLHTTDRSVWREWLAENHEKKDEIWLVFFKKASGEARLPYNDAVEEALCFGWIDSTAKRIDERKYAQRFTPRRPGSPLSELNKERVRRLMEEGRMMPAGREAAGDVSVEPLVIASDILHALQNDEQTWQNFQNFSSSYKRIRIGWIESARNRPEEFEKRLTYFLKMTAKNKQYGMVR